jgi:hypothetical protein
VSALRAALGSKYAGWAAVLLAGLAACQGVELGLGVKPAVPPPDPVVAQQVEEASAALTAAAERPTPTTRSRASHPITCCAAEVRARVAADSPDPAPQVR